MVNARHLKNVPGRKSDVQDCQWIQQLHSYGLLTASFRPAEDMRVLRSLFAATGDVARAPGRAYPASAESLAADERATDASVE